MNKSTIFGTRIDFGRSHDSYLYDANRQRFFLDFFGMYSTLPLGYSHPIFKDPAYVADMMRCASIKVTNCEIATDEADRFFRAFTSHPSMKPFAHFHFCCTGALAIEAAVKTAAAYKKSDRPHVIALRESFHGINSYGGFLTDRETIAAKRLEGMPSIGWSSVTNPKLVYGDDGVDRAATQRRLETFEEEFRACVRRQGAGNVVALIVEPIQSTAGDNYFPAEFFTLARSLCDELDIPLIFDEVQTGFGSTGKMWYFEHLRVVPDIVAFAKKAQTAGIMVREKFGAIFDCAIKLEVTWDSTLVDLVRGYYVLKAYEEHGVLTNIRARSDELSQRLEETPGVLNVRRTGSLFAFDLADGRARDAFKTRAFENGLLFNTSLERTIRLRPNLAVSSAEVAEASRIIKASV